MIKLIAVSLCLFFFLRSNIKRKDGWKNPSSFLFFLYLGTAVCSIPHLLVNGDESTVQYTLVYQNQYWVGAFAYIFFVILFLFPLWYYKENKASEIRLPSLQILNIFSAVLIVLSLYSIIFYLPSVINMFRSGVALSTLRNGLDTMRSEYVDTGGIANTIASASSGLYPFAALLFYIYYIIGNHKLWCVLLFISSTSGIVSVLSFVGRDGVVFWIFIFLFLFLMFKNYLSINQVKRIKRVFFISTIIALIPFVLISISRFGGSGSNGTISGLLSYVGQMVPNYLLYFSVKERHYNYGVSFPLFWELTNKPAPKSVRWIDGGTESNVFATFIKSYNINFGIVGTVVVGVLALAFFLLVFKKGKKVIAFHLFFIYTLYFELLSEGVFYYRQYTRGGNLFIIISLLFCLIFSIIERHLGTFILQKNQITEDRSRKKRIHFFRKIHIIKKRN